MISCAILFFCVVTFAATPNVGVVSLKQAIQNALNLSPDYLISKNQLESARLESKNAFARFLPSVDLAATHGIRRVEPDLTGETTASPVVSSATLSLTENFYDNGESISRYRIAQYRLELAELNFAQAKAKIIRSVLLAYYRHNISLQNLRFNQKNFAELERLAKLVSNQFFQGMKTKKDYLSFKTRAQRGRLDVINSEKALASARANLLATIGMSSSPSVRFDENIIPVLPKAPLSSNFDVADLYEFRSLEVQRQISEIEVTLANRKFWPELNLIGAATYGSSNYIDRGQDWASRDSTELSVLLSLKFNLIDWGVRSRNIEIATRAQNTAEQNYRSSLFAAQKELEVFKLEVERSTENYRLSKELQKMEEDTFKLLERDYRAGQTTYLELTTGLANLLDAQARGQEADFDQADLYLRWKYYKGTLSEESIFQ